MKLSLAAKENFGVCYSTKEVLGSLLLQLHLEEKKNNKTSKLCRSFNCKKKRNEKKTFFEAHDNYGDTMES
ncbi:hypothetical protein B9Z55_019394 [Caenorhabditis nigoni]|uniref:Uncharacterized protein n=1 Tax=Caenorhabditis nigoni TaxID=1611254 RepID=A0A2G5TI74_9PELO|nr:hypothetical protein B9Z55_019394 [Caenorhabditis nigoni]